MNISNAGKTDFRPTMNYAVTEASVNPKMENKPSRLLELELAKGFAIIFMIFVHVYEIGHDSIVQNDSATVFLKNLIEFLGCVPAAPLFMFCMGVGFAYSKAKSSQYIKRAGIFILLALLINVFQHLCPLLFEDNIVEKLIEKAPCIIATDIYSFVFFAMLFIAFVKIFDGELHIIIAMLFLVVFGIVNAILSITWAATGNDWLDNIYGIFVRLNDFSYFPFLIWINFPVIGYVLATLYKNASNKKHLKFVLFFAAIVLIITCSVYMKHAGMINSVEFAAVDTEGAYYAMSIPNILYSFGIVILDIAICSLFLLIRHLDAIHKILFFLSKNIARIYVLQWLFIGLTTHIIETFTSIYENMLFSLFILILTGLSAYYYDCIKKRIALKSKPLA